MKEKKNNSIAYAWKVLCWAIIIIIILYNIYLITTQPNIYAYIQWVLISIVISIFVYIISYSIAEIIQLLEDIKNK
jgi:hypothetical protein